MRFDAEVYQLTGRHFEDTSAPSNYYKNILGTKSVRFRSGNDGHNPDPTPRTAAHMPHIRSNDDDMIENAFSLTQSDLGNTVYTAELIESSIAKHS